MGEDVSGDAAGHLSPPPGDLPSSSLALRAGRFLFSSNFPFESIQVTVLWGAGRGGDDPANLTLLSPSHHNTVHLGSSEGVSASCILDTLVSSHSLLKIFCYMTCSKAENSCVVLCFASSVHNPLMASLRGFLKGRSARGGTNLNNAVTST